MDHRRVLLWSSCSQYISLIHRKMKLTTTIWNERPYANTAACSLIRANSKLDQEASFLRNRVASQLDIEWMKSLIEINLRKFNSGSLLKNWLWNKLLLIFTTGNQFDGSQHFTPHIFHNEIYLYDANNNAIIFQMRLHAFVIFSSILFALPFQRKKKPICAQCLCPDWVEVVW